MVCITFIIPGARARFLEVWRVPAAARHLCVHAAGSLGIFGAFYFCIVDWSSLTLFISVKVIGHLRRIQNLYGSVMLRQTLEG